MQSRIPGKDEDGKQQKGSVFSGKREAPFPQPPEEDPLDQHTTQRCKHIKKSGVIVLIHEEENRGKELFKGQGEKRGGGDEDESRA